MVKVIYFSCTKSLKDVLKVITHFFVLFYSNSSGSKEATTVVLNRKRTDTTGTGHNTIPTKPVHHDKFADLMALAIEPKNRHNPASFEKVIVKTEYDDLNPTLADLMDVKIR